MRGTDRSTSVQIVTWPDRNLTEYCLRLSWRLGRLTGRDRSEHLAARVQANNDSDGRGRRSSPHQTRKALHETCEGAKKEIFRLADRDANPRALRSRKLLSE